MTGPRNTHDWAATGAGLDSECTLKLQEAERFTDRGPRHAVLLHHSVFREKLFAGPEASVSNLAHELPGDADRGAFLFPFCPHTPVPPRVRFDRLTIR
jgi:hypothetical protein